MKRLPTLLLMLLAAAGLRAQNPYLPMWEYIPDGEPYVFEDPDRPGKYRVYVYGSHDNLIDQYCGRDQVVWSAPVEDLSAWRYDGIIFKSCTDARGNLLYGDGRGDVLYAPDVTCRKDAQGRTRYYLYPNNQAGGRQSMMAVSDRPDGPFEVANWNKKAPAVTDGILGFDPAVFVDDDGRVYGYWGFRKSYGAELDPATMASVKPGTEIVEDMVSNLDQPGEFRFFEASSMRKIEGKYVFIYSRWTADGEFGLPGTNYTLAYAYGNSPLGPFTYGGTIIDARARGTDEKGNVLPTANPYGNTHGSIQCINGRWWVFYHRQTGTDEYSRQAMAAPVKVKVEKGPGGRVLISEAEYTSEGFRTEGLNPLDKSAAGWACYYTNPDGIRQDYPHFMFSGSYIKSTRLDVGSYQGPFNLKEPFCPVVNNTAGSVVGYKYFDFSRTAGSRKVSLVLHIVPDGNAGTISVLVGGPSAAQGGRKIADVTVSDEGAGVMTEVSVPCDALGKVSGKQSLFFRFDSDTKGSSICQLYDFRFVISR